MLKFIFSSFLLLYFSACTSENSVDHAPSVVGDIKDTAAWYSDANSNLLEMNVIIPSPNSSLCAPYDDPTGEVRPCTLDDINHDLDAGDTYEPILNVKMYTSTFPLASDATNATFSIRGNFTRTANQKSYGIKLDSDTYLLLNQRKFQLNKHESDQSRVKNKLAFDLFREIPHFTSLKTQFVNLKIDNIDYGLFTHVEAIREEYLVNRGWNKDDNLYNTVYFLFAPRSDLSVDANGAPLDPVAFDTILEIKNGKNHTKLVEMLDAIDTTTDIDAVVAKYFNRDNYITWLAVNLVLSNKDTAVHNFYLYNPINSNTFYFLPWDYDGAWAPVEYLGKDEYGISVWWDSPLHKKFLTKEKNREDVYAMAEEIRSKYITNEKIQAHLDEYNATVEHFSYTEPDSQNNSFDSWQYATAALVTDIDKNMALYKSVIGHPMPFHEYASYADGTLDITWDEAVDFEGDEIVYDVNVSSDMTFTTNLVEAQDLNTTALSANITLTPGIYYLKVVAREKNNPTHYQLAFEKVFADGVAYGVLEFEVQ